MMKISIFPTPSTQVPEILLHSFMCFDLGHSHIFLWRHGLGLNHWEAHVYLKGYKDGVRFSESTSSSNPNYQILHPGFWFQLITAPVEQILKNFMMWPPGESKASKHPVNCWEQHCFTRKPSLMMSSLWITISWDVAWAICGARTSHRMNSLSLKLPAEPAEIVFAKASFSSCHVWWNNV